MKKTIWFAVILIVIIGIYIATNRNVSNDTIKIGVVTPLTGSAAFVGQQFQTGMQIAVEKINKQGINGKKVQLIFEDSRSIPKEGVNAWKNAMLLKPDVMVSALSGVSMALAPPAKSDQVPLLVSITTASNLTEQNEWTFRYFATAKQEIPPLIKIAKSLNVKRIGVIYQNDDFGLSMLKTLTESFDGVVNGESFGLQETDFRTQLTKIKSFGPDAILIVGLQNQLVGVAKQSRELGLNIPIFSASTAGTPTVRQALMEADVSLYAGIPDIYSNKSDNPEFVSLEKEYVDKKIATFDHSVSAGYDTVNLIVNAIRISGSSRQEIKDGLNKIKSFDGVMGNVQISGREFSFTLYPAYISNGNVQYLK
jgi:branched-chain amino acid transport system substrate-binding protein